MPPFCSSIFTNVSKGQFAPSDALKKAFETTDEESICRIILTKGQIQVSELERSAQLENTILEIASMVSEKCVNPVSNRRYTPQTIRDAIKEADFSVHPTRSVKQQFLDCVKLLKDKAILPIERAKMELCIVTNVSKTIGKGDESDDSDDDYEEDVNTYLRQLSSEIKVTNTSVTESPVDNGENTKTICKKVEFLIDPSLYRKINNSVKKFPSWRLEILQQCVFEEGEANLENEIQRKDMMALEQQQYYQKEQTIADNLVDNLQEALTLDDGDQSSEKKKNEHEDKEIIDNIGNDYSPPPNVTRKNLKKAQKKKSKKAKRREKEDKSEREEKRRVEQERQAERANLRSKNDDQKDVSLPQEYNGGSSNRPTGSGGGMKSCNTCGGSFTLAEYRAHFKSDWHRYNIKLKMKGIKPATLEEFQVCDAETFFEDF